jgi:hypothetical protein
VAVVRHMASIGLGEVFQYLASSRQSINSHVNQSIVMCLGQQARQQEQHCPHSHPLMIVPHTSTGPGGKDKQVGAHLWCLPCLLEQ